MDPLHQDSDAMEQWLHMNLHQDFEGMYRISSPWLKQDMTEQQFIKAYGYVKTRTAPPPDIHFVASVPMPSGSRENFYLIEEPGDTNLEDGVMVKVLLDENGYFLSYPY